MPDWNNVTKVYRGQTPVSKVYIGDELVWPSKKPYIEFSSPSSFTLKTYNTSKNWDGILEYSTDTDTWSTWNGSVISASSDNGTYYLYLRGYNNTIIAGKATGYLSGHKFVLTGNNVSCSGDVRCLLDYRDPENTSMSAYCFAYLFYGGTALVNAPELPSTVLSNYCYNNMFSGCASLVNAPELPATVLNVSCYNRMFQYCTSLVNAPELPATTLAGNCYTNMFEGCTSLVNAPELPATTLTGNCYESMFYDCTSLVNAPELPATTLTGHCYEYMFYGCTSLVNAPELPATTLAGNCYESMFSGCTSLINAPELPAMTLDINCYEYMFEGCTSLVTAPELPATTLDQACYRWMFSGCTSLRTLPELPATDLEDNCYESMFSGCTSIKLSEYYTSIYTESFCIPSSGYASYVGSDALESMFEDTGGDFVGTPIEETEYYLMNPIYFNYLTFSSPSSFTLKTNNTSKNWDGILEYSTDTDNWSTWNGSVISASSNNGTYYLYLRGYNNTIITGNGTNYKFVLTGSNVSCSGDIRYLLDYRDPENTSMSAYCFAYLFYESAALASIPDTPATTLASYCYYYMFRQCTSITAMKELPATNLVEGCYYGMFEKCSSLTTLVPLPSMTMAKYCYRAMFSECTSITAGISLPATTLAVGCYRYMFNGCSNMETIIALPALDITSEAYYYLFANCSKIMISTSKTGNYQTAYRFPTTGNGSMASGATRGMIQNTGGAYTVDPIHNFNYYTSNTII